MSAPMIDDPVSDFDYSHFDDESLDFIRNATKFCQIRAVQEFLIPAVREFVLNAP